MSVSSITWSPTAQWGGSTGAVWVDQAIAPLLIGTGAPCNPVLGFFAGAIFDANADQTLRFATVGGVARPLDPPILLSPFRLDVTIGGSILDGGTDNRLEIGVVPDGSPADYANGATNVPWGRGESALETFTLANVPAFPLDPIPFSLTLGTASVTLIRALVTSRGDWNGRLALSFRAAGANSFDLYNATPGATISAVTSQESVFFSGLAGGPFGGKVRAVRDGRFAMPAMNTELVRDGDNPGLWVRPHDFDPEDPEQTYRPRPGEGSVDDQIPDL